MTNPAKIYSEKRKIVFSTFHKDPEKAYEYLMGYRKVLGPKGFAGLKAEFEFYKNYDSEFNLTLSLDAGDHTDFSGIVDNKPFRIDVTTNENFKKLSDYEPFQKKGKLYKIAIIDKDNGSLKDLIDINFPFCESCGTHRIFRFTIVLPEDVLKDGGSTCCHDHVLLEGCPNCGDYNEIERVNIGGLPDLGTYKSDL